MVASPSGSSQRAEAWGRAIELGRAPTAGLVTRQEGRNRTWRPTAGLVTHQEGRNRTWRIGALAAPAFGAQTGAMSRRCTAFAPLLLLAGCFPPLPDVPAFERVEAFCDSDDEWNLFAQIDHAEGPEAITAAWTEVGYAFYDENDEAYTEGAIGAPVDLLRVEGTDDEWSIRVLSDPSFLDCDYAFEYWFLFVAEDDDGDQAGRSIVN